MSTKEQNLLKLNYLKTKKMNLSDFEIIFCRKIYYIINNNKLLSPSQQDYLDELHGIHSDTSWDSPSTTTCDICRGSGIAEVFDDSGKIMAKQCPCSRVLKIVDSNSLSV